MKNPTDDASVATVKRARTAHDVPRLAILRVLFSPDPTHVGASLQVSGPVHVGRAADVQLGLADPQVSRVHATFAPAPDMQVKVTDSSTNGTFVNRERVVEAVLRDGDVVRVGDSLLLLRYEPEHEPPGPPVPGLKGEGPGMSELRRTIDRVAPTDATVLVLGETGTGKEVVARAVYALSGSAGPFVAVNCAALPGALAESQLFGHVAGAIPDAAREHDGYVRAAHGGVLFLDEVGELTLELQGKLLRFLDERSALPVGTTHAVHSNVRVIAATNRELREAVDAGRFRGDLYARLAEITIRTVPLRARAEDILPAMTAALGVEPEALSPDLAEALVLYEWPFNVRELLKVAKELSIRGDAAQGYGLDLVRERLREYPGSPVVTKGSATPPPQSKPNADPPIPIPTADDLVALLRKHHGVISNVAKATGRSRRQVQRWVEKYGVDVSAYASERRNRTSS